MFQTVVNSCCPIGVGARGRGARRVVERRDVERLVDADTARRERRDVRERIASEHAEERVEADRDAVGGEQHGDDADLAAPAEQLRNERPA